MSIVKIGIAAESRGDARLIKALVDRMLIEEIAWVADTFEACRGAMDDGLSPCRSFEGIEGSAFLDIHDATEHARNRRLRFHGHFNGEPAASDAQMFRAALVLFAEEAEPPKAVVIARDVDDDAERRKGFTQADKVTDWPFKVIGALATPEIEAWLVAAWTPEDRAERERHQELNDELHFDPCAHPERLTSKNESDPKDAKRILDLLTKTGRDAAERWDDAPLDRLESNGAGCGLGQFVRDVKGKLIPVMNDG